MNQQVSITPNGRMSLPAEIRKRLGVAGGGTLVVEETPDGVILRTVAQSIAHAAAIGVPTITSYFAHKLWTFKS